MATRSELSSNWRAMPDIPSSPSLSRNIGPNVSLSNDPQPIAPGRRDPSKRFSTTLSSENVRGEDDSRTLQAIQEGRRLYVGNLPYMAKMKDVEWLFVSNGYQIEHINMSTDPYTGRNPSYCFIELTSKAQADKAMQELSDRDLLGRPVKLGPGVARSGKRQLEQPVFQRWARTDAPGHFEGYSEQGRRLWVGGLPKMADHGAVNAGIRELFEGFEIEAVSKVIIPKTPTLGDPKAWNHRYLFVDFPSADEARRAAKATDGRYAWDVKIRVQPARSSDSRKPRERDEWDEDHFVSQSS